MNQAREHWIKWIILRGPFFFSTKQSRKRLKPDNILQPSSRTPSSVPLLTDQEQQDFYNRLVQ